ncbi:MAG: dUTP diphosphatase [Proteobacteria bacterium]|nr:dUTP diphosphatase [Pseudomonadota bacterium]
MTNQALNQISNQNPSKTILRIKRLENNHDLPLPKYETLGSAGMDLTAAIDEDLILKAGETTLVKTGIAIALEKGYEAQIRPRSGLALKNGITVLNTPGTIDSDYRGEVCVILINHSKQDFTISRGMRIAQMIIAAYVQPEIQEVTSLDQTARGEGGFGSTGTH